MKIITEILETERTYVRELQALDCLYIKDSLKQDILTAEEHRTVFGNLAALTIFHHDHFLPAMEEVCIFLRSNVLGL